MRKRPKTNHPQGSIFMGNSAVELFEKRRDFAGFEDTFPLTPALTLGEKEKRSQRSANITIEFMAVHHNMGTGRARHSVRAAVVNQKALVGNSGGQRTARPTNPCANIVFTCYSSKKLQSSQLNELHSEPKSEFCSQDIRQSESIQQLSPLPEGEGQGEGEARELSDRYQIPKPILFFSFLNLPPNHAT